MSNERDVNGRFIKGHKKIGGFIKGDKRITPMPFTLVREKINMLTPIEDLGTHGSKYKRFIKCLCDCGEECIVSYNNFKNGHTKSCGCRKLIGSRLDHGMSGTTEHRIWSKMIDRCRNKNCQEYPNYGGRGIKVCKRWEVFINFLEDMGHRPSPQHSLDRFPNNDGNYEPSNCRWATRVQQQRNKRTNVFYEYNGVRMIQCEWAETLGVKVHMIDNHIRRGKTFPETVAYLKSKNYGLANFQV